MYFKKIRSVFNENTDLFYVKKLDLKSTNQFFELEKKKIGSVFNENTDLFYVKKIISKKYKSVFKLEKNSDLKNSDQFLDFLKNLSNIADFETKEKELQ